MGVRTLRAMVAAVVVTAFLAVAGGIAVEPTSRAAEAASLTSLKAQALYFQKKGKVGARDLVVGSMGSASAWQAGLWADFVGTWSTINKSMTMNTKVPGGLPTKGHVFVVLGSALKKSGAVSTKFERRLKLALKALKKYPKAKVLVTGGAPRNGRTEATAGYKWLVARDVRKSRILLEKKAASTIGNAKNSMAMLAKSDYTSYSLISDSSHLRRASILFEAAEVLVQEESGKEWPIKRLANVAYLDMAKAGKAPLSSSSVAYTTGNVASVLGVASAYKKVLAKPPAAAVLTSVTLTAPAKVTYAVGEGLSTRGMVVKAVYNKGVYTRAVTRSAKVTGFSSAEVGEGTATAKYSDGGVAKTASFAYTIVKATSTVGVKLSTTKPKHSKTKVVAKATVTPAVSGLVPTGTVRFYRDGVRLKSVTLDPDAPGVARFTFPAIDKVGMHKLTVKYLGDDSIETARKSVTITVK